MKARTCRQGRAVAIAMLTLLLAILEPNSPAFAQSGSVGGSVGPTGDEPPKEPAGGSSGRRHGLRARSRGLSCLLPSAADLKIIPVVIGR